MCNRVCQRVVPNVLVVSFGSGLVIATVFFLVPDAVAHGSSPMLMLVARLVVLAFYGIWLSCWLIVAVGDPGRIRDDLRRRGVLTRVLQGDIPRCLRHLPICSKCGLPQPANAYHCEVCDECVLRYDHHCGVTGQCVADKNFKPFCLSFMYGGLMGFSMALTCLANVLAVGEPGIVALVVLIYSGILGLVLVGFGLSFFCSGRRYLSVYDRITMKRRSGVTLKKFLASFGDTWFERICPIQKTSTQLAWPGVDWENEDAMPL